MVYYKIWRLCRSLEISTVLYKTFVNRQSCLWPPPSTRPLSSQNVRPAAGQLNEFGLPSVFDAGVSACTFWVSIIDILEFLSSIRLGKSMFKSEDSINGNIFTAGKALVQCFNHRVIFIHNSEVEMFDLSIACWVP